MSEVETYVRDNWHRAIYRDEPGTGFGGVDLPHRYSTASIRGEGRFSYFFYWDTYFTHPGLLAHGHDGVARDNIRNILWLIGRQGYMPNHVGIYNRSQPPFLCRMIEDYLSVMRSLATADGPALPIRSAVAGLVAPPLSRGDAATDGGSRAGDAAGADLHRWAFRWDPEFYRGCAEGIRREHQFWLAARTRPSGLAGYGHHTTAAAARAFYDRTLVKRLGVDPDADAVERARVGGHYLGEAESGWDFCRRFDGRCLDHSAVDLNALLAGHERFLTHASGVLGWEMESWYRECAQHRLDRIEALLWDEPAGWYFDYDETTEHRSPVMSLAALTPLFAGIATNEHADKVARNLVHLELDHGIAVTDDRAAGGTYQWGYPNVWPCQVYVAVSGLARYGHHADAERIARKFIATTDRLFAKTGMLWEKTDAETGDIAGGEYEAVPMLGWTAGTYVALSAYLEGIEGQLS